MSLLQSYKGFVRAHPGLVLNAERLLHWVAWNPERFSGSEYAYEGFNAAVGLLGIYNESILTHHPDYNATVAKYALWLAAVEQVQTLVELRAIQLEQRGKMSRYGPLMVLELVKALLRLQLWRSSKCTLALEAVSQEDQEQHECEQQLQELLQALTRLRQRYSCDETAAPTPDQLAWQQQLLQEQRVRSAAIAPCRPPAACAAGELARANGPAGCLSNGCSSSSSSSSNVGGRSALQQDSSRDSSLQQQGQQGWQSCSRHIPQHNSSSSSSSSGAGGGGVGACQLPPVPEIVPADMPILSTSKTSSSSSSSKLHSGWWRCMTSLYPSSRPSSNSRQQQQQQQQCGSVAAQGSAANTEVALQGSWGPSSRELYGRTAASLGSTHDSSSSSRLLRFPAGSSSSSNQHWQQHQQVKLQALPWCLCSRDGSIGHSVMRAGELLHVMRPLLYVYLLKRYGLRSWKPWVLSLGFDLASGYGLHTGHAILSRSNASRWPPGSTLYSLALLRSLSSNRWSPGEQAELLGRRLQLLRYLLRSPCYDAVTRRLLQRMVTSSRWLPGLSSLTEFAFNMVEGMQSYYTYVEC